MNKKDQVRNLEEIVRQTVVFVLNRTPWNWEDELDLGFLDVIIGTTVEKILEEIEKDNE